MSITMRLVPNKNIMDNNQVIDNQLCVKVVRMSLVLLVLLIVSTHVHRHLLTNTDVMPVSTPSAIPLHDKINMTTSSTCTYIEKPKIRSSSNSSTDMKTTSVPSLSSPCTKSIPQSHANSECK